MSRSFKKAPVHHVCVTGHNDIQKAKRSMTRSLRHKLNDNEDPGNNSWHKKLCLSWRWSPGDGKVWAEEYVKRGKKEWISIKGK